jgi:large subunit ribosomal protein L15
MKYHQLQVASTPSRRRVGRGISAGQGKTAGRGTKGQKSRTGAAKRPGFEGGQNPLLQRLPKLRGFKSHRPAVENVYTGQLEGLGTTVTNQTLAEAGLISSAYTRVKLLSKGELTKKATVKLQAASVGAIKAVEKAGGSFAVTTQIGRPKKAKEPADKAAA